MTAKPERRHYVYVISHDGKPLYVGKGQGTRCMNHMQRDDMRDKHDLTIRVFYMDTENAAFAVEHWLINYWGLDQLLNKSPGHLPPHDFDDSAARDVMQEALEPNYDTDARIKNWIHRVNVVASLSATNAHFRQPDQSRQALRRIYKMRRLRHEILQCMGQEAPLAQLHYVDLLVQIAQNLQHLRRAARCDVETVREYEQDLLTLWSQFQLYMRTLRNRVPEDMWPMWRGISSVINYGPWNNRLQKWILERMDGRIRRMWFMLGKWINVKGHRPVETWNEYDWRWMHGG